MLLNILYSETTLYKKLQSRNFILASKEHVHLRSPGILFFTAKMGILKMLVKNLNMLNANLSKTDGAKMKVSAFIDAAILWLFWAEVEVL